MGNLEKKELGLKGRLRDSKKQLPEMECSKQLTEIVKKLYKPGQKNFDFGCASGHYYNSLKKLNPKLNYTGFDATKPYIKFAKNFLETIKTLVLMFKVYLL